MATVNGLDRLVAKLRERAARARTDAHPSVVVGYSASYAIAVHENIEMKWRGVPRKGGRGVYWGPSGQAKFLEEPARTLAPEFRRIITEAARKGATLAKALLLAGLHLQRASQKLVPVDTGNLRASAFTRLE